MKPLWFKNKTYGWGWYPATWQGWAVMAAWLVPFVLVVRRAGLISPDRVLWEVALPAFGLTGLLLLVAWKTGEKPRWRWGKDT